MKQTLNTKVIGTKWVFAIKWNDRGEIERYKYKARFVALGYRQTASVDYSEMYSPVANLSSIRVFLALCCQQGYHIQQYDVDTAFLNGYLQEDVYIRPPEGVSVQAGHVCKLHRSLYGLKQAAITWYKMISEVFVTKLEFVRCKSDSCMLVRQSGRE